MAKLETFTLEEILQEVEDETDWVVEELITTGLHLLVGPPKVGKSWLTLGMGIAVCQGDPFLGFATSKSKVLYLALEDPRKRIKKRAWKLLDETTGELYFATASEKVTSGLIPQIEPVGCFGADGAYIRNFAGFRNDLRREDGGYSAELQHRKSADCCSQRAAEAGSYLAAML